LEEEDISIADQMSCFLHDYYNLNKPFQETCWDINNEIQSAVLRDAKRIVIDFKAIEEFDEKYGTKLGGKLLSVKEDDLQKIMKTFEDETNKVDRITKAHMMGELNNPNLTKEDLERIQKENKLKLGIKNLPVTITIPQVIKEEHQGKLVQVEGIVQNIGIPYRFSRRKVFVCENCSFEIKKSYEIIEKKTFNKMFCPSCKMERTFTEKKDEELVLKTQLLTLVEGVAMTSSMPISLLVVLFEDLIDSDDPDRRKFIAGVKIKAVGILKEMKIPSTVKKIYLEVIHWQIEEEDMRYTDTDIVEFKKVAEDKNLIDNLIKSFCPSIYGYEEVKEGMILQIVGGVSKTSPIDKKFKRGNIHILLVGDPSLGKSSLLMFNFSYLPKCRYAVCSPSSMTGAGLGVAMLKDPETNSFYLASGVLVSSSGSLALLDEIDKADPNDIKSLDVVMEMAKLPVDKAGISIKLKADSSILAVANPKGSRFDPYINLREQVTLNDVTLSRFDLRYAFMDRPNETIDSEIADKIINFEESKTPFTSEFLFKYLLYARKKEPKLNDETSNLLKDFYIKMRQKSQGESGALMITARQLGGLIRLSEAYAKLRLADETNKDDAERAIELFKKQLRTFGLNPETGELDIDKAEGRKSAQDRRESRSIDEIYNELVIQFGKRVPKNDMIQAMGREGIKEKVLTKAIRENIYYEPEEGFIQKV
jgi:replicative DNA helicase Mcm